MRGYTARQVEEMLGLSPSQVRGWVRDGFLAPERGPRGELRFSFQDLVLLRTARGLLDAEVPAHRVRRALRRLRARLPEGQPLTGVHIHADGRRILIRDGNALLEPESGQGILDFRVADLAREVASLETAEKKKKKSREEEAERDAEAWYVRGCELEETDPGAATEAYRSALALDPGHAEAHVNLGRLLHDAGDLSGAEAEYQLGIAARPGDTIAAFAAFNLGVVLEDQERLEEAVAAYERAIAEDPTLADAHFNLSRLHEQLGHRAAALRHLQTYRRLTRG